MKVTRKDHIKRKPSRWPLWLTIGVIAVTIGIWKWPNRSKSVSHPTTPSSNETKIIPTEYTALDPVIVNHQAGIIAIPLQSKDITANILVYHRGSNSKKLLFTQPLVIGSMAALAHNNESILAFTVATEDTNSNGKIDSADIHQLYWYSPNSGKVNKVSKPIFHFINYSATLPSGRTDSGAWGQELLYKVSMDSNHNGTVDVDDPIQLVLIDLDAHTIVELLPEGIVPTTSILAE
jgi:hypothetical protein